MIMTQFHVRPLCNLLWPTHTTPVFTAKCPGTLSETLYEFSVSHCWIPGWLENTSFPEAHSGVILLKWYSATSKIMSKVPFSWGWFFCLHSTFSSFLRILLAQHFRHQIIRYKSETSRGLVIERLKTQVTRKIIWWVPLGERTERLSSRHNQIMEEEIKVLLKVEKMSS